MLNKIRNPKRRQSKLSPTDNAPDSSKKPRTNVSAGSAQGVTDPGQHEPSRGPTTLIMSPTTNELESRPLLSPPASPSPSSLSAGDNVIQLGHPRAVTEGDITSDAQELLEGSTDPTNPNASPTHKPKTRGSAWKGLEKAMRALHLTADAVPAVKSAVGGFVSCIDHFEVARKNREEYDDVVSELGKMAEHLSRHLKDPRSRGLTERISEIAKRIEKEIEEVRKLQEGSKTTQVLRATDREEDLAHRFRRVSELFRRIQMEISMSDWSNTHETLMNGYLEKLKPATLARYDSSLSDAIGRRACTEDTRGETLSELTRWCNNPNSPNIYWMNGMAGTGKTTIAYTLASELESRGQLGASFFCTVTSEECRQASRIIPTIAYQLARQSTPYQAVIGEVLKRDPDAGRLEIPKQMKQLLTDPLGTITDNMPRSLIIVIDALDECHDSNVVRLILESLLCSAQQIPLKFFITSRPEPPIHEKLAKQPDNLRSVLYLHEVDRDSIQRDIKLYLEEELKAISPSDDEINRLAKLSEHLFIYAATAVRYVIPDNASVNSRARLQVMLDITSKSTKKHSGIDALYTTILSNSVDNDALEPDERENVLSVVWAVVSSNQPVSITELGIIAGLSDEPAVLAALSPLRSLLHVSDTENTISTFHASFPQFIFEQTRSNGFFCDPVVIRRTSALRCLKVINAQQPNLIWHETNTCTYLTVASNKWVRHLCALDSDNPGEIYLEVRRFFEEQFESWVRLQLFGPSVLPYGALLFFNIKNLKQWLKEVKAPADLRRAAGNAWGYRRWSEKERQLVRDKATQSHIETPNGSTEIPRYKSWIWQKINLKALKRQALDEVEVDNPDSEGTRDT